ncbi:MAG: multidrug effflux MFS transporter [Candidatus Rokubacteria bacterium]|nr:multidrug effflux MFS transporter [Candidatus Rokubacteria bacterium]
MTADGRRRAAAESTAVTFLLSALLAITPFTLDIALPALPSVAAAFGGDAGRVKLMIALFLLGMAGGQLLYGPASDRLGRRPVLLGALGLYLAATILCAVAPSLEWLLAARFVQGLGACAGPVIARAIVRDVYEPVRGARVLSLAAMGMSLAPIVAPLTGGLLVRWTDWRIVFVVLAVFATLLVGATALVLPETNAAERRARTSRSFVAGYLVVVRNPLFVGYVLTLSAGSVGLFAWLSGSPFVLMTWLGLPPELYGVAFATVSLGQLGGAALAARLAGTLGIERTVATGLVLYLAGGATLAGFILAGFAHPAAIVGPMALFQFGNGLVMPNVIAGAVAPFPRHAGAASALAGFLQMVSGALSGMLLGAVHDGSARPMGFLVAAAAVAATLAFRLVVWPRRARREPA